MNKNDRVKRSSHEFELQYTIYNEPHKDTIQIDFYDEETLYDVIDDYIDDFISDAFQDVIADAVAEGGASMNATGIYEIAEVASNVYSSAYSYLEDKAKEFSLIVVDNCSDELETKLLPIDILKKLKAKLEDRETCECWDVDVGWAISGDAIDFQTEGVWQYGLASAEGILCNPKEWPAPKQRNGNIVWETDNEELTYSIGSEIIFPCYRVAGAQTINQARGCNHRIRDRIDLTLECIRRYYHGDDSPLYKCLCAYKSFFDLFVDFKGYVDFFHLQDLVTKNYSAVEYLTWFDGFHSNYPLPRTVEEYVDYIVRVMNFIKARNERIDTWCRKQGAE